MNVHHLEMTSARFQGWTAVWKLTFTSANLMLAVSFYETLDCSSMTDNEMKPYAATSSRGFRSGGKPSLARQGAFTLVEVMMATIITVVMFASFYSAITSGVLTIQVARENLRATQIMVNRMEGIRLFTFAQLSDTNLLPRNFVENYYPSGTNGDNGITYTGIVSVVPAILTSPAPSYASNLYSVAVQLNWQSVGALHTRTMTTYCAKWGIQNYVWASK